MDVLTGLTSATERFLEHYGLIALFALILVEEAGVWLPLPGDLLVMYFGARVASSSRPLLDALPVIAVITAAALCGSFLLYLLTRRFQGLVRRLGPLIRLDEQRLDWMAEKLHRYGVAIIVPARLMPGLRVVTTVVCGVLKVPASRFVPAIAIASAIWAAAYMALGAAGLSLAGLLRPLIPDEPRDWLLVLLGLAALVVLSLIAHHLFSRSGSSRSR